DLLRREEGRQILLQRREHHLAEKENRNGVSFCRIRISVRLPAKPDRQFRWSDGRNVYDYQGEEHAHPSSPPPRTAPDRRHPRRSVRRHRHRQNQRRKEPPKRPCSIRKPPASRLHPTRRGVGRTTAGNCGGGDVFPLIWNCPA